MALPVHIARLQGPNFSIAGLHITPDEAWLAACARNGAVYLWSLNHPAEPPLRLAWKGITRIASDGTGQRLVGLGRDRIGHLWDYHHQETVAEWPMPEDGPPEVEAESLNTGPRRPTLLAWHPDAETIALRGNTTGVVLLQAFTGEERARMSGHTAPLTALAFAPDGRLASGDADGMIGIWDRDAAQLALFQAHRRGMTSLAWDHSSRKLISAGHDGKLRVWDLMTGEGRLLPPHHVAAVTELQWLADGRHFVAASPGDRLTLWQARQGRVRSWCRMPPGVRSVGLSPDGTWYALGGPGSDISLWSTPWTEIPHAVASLWYLGEVLLNELAGLPYEAPISPGRKFQP